MQEGRKELSAARAAVCTAAQERTQLQARADAIRAELATETAAARAAAVAARGEAEVERVRRQEEAEAAAGAARSALDRLTQRLGAMEAQVQPPPPCIMYYGVCMYIG